MTKVDNLMGVAVHFCAGHSKTVVPAGGDGNYPGQAGRYIALSRGVVPPGGNRAIAGQGEAVILSHGDGSHLGQASWHWVALRVEAASVGPISKVVVRGGRLPSRQGGRS